MIWNEVAPMLIGELADRSGVDARTIRYYESVGVLPEPARSRSGYRNYSDADETRLRFVRTTRALGFRLGEIREILALRDRGIAPCRYVTDLIERRLTEVGQALSDLRTVERDLQHLHRRAQQLPPAEPADTVCHIIEQ